ncbi:MAG: hypothetical protein CR991_02405 [Proteobacteria bacterium]|nr:MAG: hypothetical protein CR991_02405 [Pseudomonadota bacterium]
MDLPVYLNAFTALLVIVDPIGTALIFNTLVPPDDTRHRFTMALKGVLISCVLLIVFGLYGQPLLHRLGININALRIAGGLLLFYTSFKMITGNIRYHQTTQKEDIAVFPLSIPLLAGPGSLTLSMLLFSAQSQHTGQLAVAIAIMSLLTLTFICLLASQYIKTLIGRTGDEILRHFLGVILAALAVQFVYDGIINLGSINPSSPSA